MAERQWQGGGRAGGQSLQRGSGKWILPWLLIQHSSTTLIRSSAVASRFIPLPRHTATRKGEEAAGEVLRAGSPPWGRGRPQRYPAPHCRAGARTHHQKPVLLLGGPGEHGLLTAKLPRGCQPIYTSTSIRCLPEAPPPVGNTPNSSTMETPLSLQDPVPAPFPKDVPGIPDMPEGALAKVTVLGAWWGNPQASALSPALGHYLSMWKKTLKRALGTWEPREGRPPWCAWP